METSATSGVVTTQYFEEQPNPNLFLPNVYYHIRIFPPEAVMNKTDVTLHIKLEKLSMTGLSSGWETMTVHYSNPESWLTSLNFNFTPPAGDMNYYREVSLDRYKIIKEDFLSNEFESMPGFRLRWYYTGLDDAVIPDSYFWGVQANQLFIWY